MLHARESLNRSGWVRDQVKSLGIGDAPSGLPDRAHGPGRAGDRGDASRWGKWPEGLVLACGQHIQKKPAIGVGRGGGTDVQAR